ncbi:TetR/AcrR family transcriptional regulator [Fodinicola acaciae]|uniref:TetR/AcrR family transcriptional regulator n=1 Tax=Fodinicola acaciae TaxID=2681555 RepID=UPI0013D16FC7|nr:TetR/AcrR family transcriptional regulator [Fodinicola acaciae]
MRTVDPQKHAARVRQIREGAVDAFAENGYANCTVADLRRATGVSSGALFHYFADKAAIFRAIVEEGCHHQREQVEAIDTADPLGAFWRLVDVLCEDFDDPRTAGMAVAILERVSADAGLAALLAEQEAVVLTLATRIVERLQEKRLIDATTPARRIAKWIVTVVDGLYLHCSDDDFDAAAETDFLRQALRRTFLLHERRA